MFDNNKYFGKYLYLTIITIQYFGCRCVTEKGTLSKKFSMDLYIIAI